MAGTSNRGFASMNREKQREIASKGGRAAHQKGTAHEFSSDEAREAGRKGGQAVSRNREHMAAIGRKGGMESGARARKTSPEPESMQSSMQQTQSSTNPGQDQDRAGSQPMGNNPM